MTEGVLLRMLSSDDALKQYDAIVLDEVLLHSVWRHLVWRDLVWRHLLWLHRGDTYYGTFTMATLTYLLRHLLTTTYYTLAGYSVPSTTNYVLTRCTSGMWTRTCCLACCGVSSAAGRSSG